MKRICVIDIAGASPRMLAREGGLWTSRLPSPPRPVRAVLPAVGPVVQASMTTGVEPGQHGIVSGVLFRRQSRTLSFDERSNTLLNKKRFWHARRLPAPPSVAMMFWTNPLAGAADYVLGAMTYGRSCGSVVGQPLDLYQELHDAMGLFDPCTLHGPRAGVAAAEWIASASVTVWRRRRPDLEWVFLPGVDCEIVRHGVHSPQAAEALRTADRLASEIAEVVLADGGEVVVLSDGGFVDVTRASFPNVRLREAGLLKVLETQQGPQLDLQNTRALAVTDHQVAHLYCEDEIAAQAACAALAGDPAIEGMLQREDAFACGLGRDRAGERLLVAARDSWFAYPWWSSPDEAPSLASAEDPAGKCGYDPCELFPGAGDGRIDPDVRRVKASRGLISGDVVDQCFLASTFSLPEDPLRATDLPDVLKRVLFG